MSKKITHFGRICVSYVLVLTLVFSFVMSSFVGLDITASAASSPNPSAFDLWEGNRPTSLEGLNMNGEGTKASPFEITNPDQLWFAVNSNNGYYFKVMNDININDVSNFDTWTNTNPDGVEDWNPTGKFIGNFDGNKKTIRGLYSSCAHAGIGLFSTLGDNAFITNVIVENAYLSYTSTGSMTFVGGIAGSANNVTGVYIYGCVVKNSYLNNSRAGDAGVGGIIGASYATGAHKNVDTLTLVNCYAVDNRIEGACKWSAGLVSSHWDKYVNMTNCFTNNHFLGHRSGLLTANNCYVGGEVEKPFFETAEDFGESTNIYKIAINDMKGEDALTNMNLSANEWDITEDSYPLPKAYRDVYTFLESDKITEDTAFAGGDGTKNSPYQITNAAQLWKAVSNTDANNHFKVMNDITINNTDDFDTWSDSSSFVDWNPANTFSGTFDGNQKTIKGLYVSHASTDSYQGVGLFGRVGSNANIYDVIIDHAYVVNTTTSKYLTGAAGLIGIIKTASDINVYGCIVKNSYINHNYITGACGVGGIIGFAYQATNLSVKSCYSVDNTLEGCQYAAGIIGGHWGNTSVSLDSCFSTGYPIGHKKGDLSVSNCFVSDDVVHPYDEPYDSESYGDFGTDTNIYQVAKANMIGAAALTNMNLSSLKWTAVENDYPLPVPFNVLNAFTEADKDTTAIEFAGGTGTKDDPYQITNAAQLWKAVSNTDANNHFKVMNDITINNISSFDDWNDDSSFVDWDPNVTFLGTFDGNQKTIKGLYVSSSTSNFLGLFSRVGSNVLIHDVIVDHAYVSYTGSASMPMAGGLIGTAQSATNIYIYGCIVKNSKITGRSGQAGEGGLIGGAWSSSSANTITLKNCYAVDNTLSGRSDWSSGLMAARWTTSTTMINCFTTDAPLEHESQSATTTNCYVSGDVDHPFTSSSYPGVFGESGVYKIENNKMKGSDALTNMNLAATEWTTVVDDYPMPRTYSVVVGNFTAADKNMDAITFVGAGTKDNPYQITNPAELWKAVNNTDASKHFIVMNDIVINDTSSFSEWDDNLSYEDWTPDAIFVGEFNGNQKTISGLYASSTNSYIGLFSRVGSNALIYDVIIDHAYVCQTGSTSMSLVGGLIGGAQNTTNVYVYGCIVKNSKIFNRHTGDAAEGGLIGGAYSSSDTNIIALENCYAVDNELLGCKWSSGLMAARWKTSSTIINCFTTDAPLEHQSDADVTNSYVSGDVEYPFADDTATFGDATGIYKIDNADMKGDLALENMKLSSATWTIVADTYPMPKPYVFDQNIWGGDDGVTSFVQLEGDGTQESPYLITNASELWFVVNNTSKIGTENDKIPYFRLENDINLNVLSNYDNWATEAPANSWLPSGAFVGHFNGNFKTITGLYAAPSTEASAGLFAALDSGSSVKNLTLDKSYIKAAAGTTELVVGGIVGKIDGEADVVLEGLSVKNTVLEGRGLTGGIVGLITNSTGAVIVERAASVDNTITVIDLSNGTSAAAGLVGDAVNNDANTAVIAHSFTTSNYISRQSAGAIYNNVYTTDDMAKPFALEDTAFNTSVKAIALADMKGDNAVTNMALDKGHWEAVTDSYPVVKPYADPNNFSAADKTLTIADLNGEGTQENPYEITNAAELWVAVNNTDPLLYFKVMNDITVNNISDYSAWDDDSDMEDWTPTEKFSGNFDGNKKVISGLYASSSTANYLGLFSQLGDEVRIIDVIIDKAYFAQTSTTTSMTLVGGLIGKATGVTDIVIYGCVVRNSTIINRYTGDGGEGGLIGGAYSTSRVGDIEIANCYAVDNKLNNKCNWSSGLVAARWKTKISLTDCFTTDAPLEHQYSDITVNNCYVSGDVQYPFKTSPSADFGDATGVYKIDNAAMKGADALTNMNFSSENWKATDGYPESLIKFKDNEGKVGEVWSGGIARKFAGGDGTEANPWQIDTPERLYKMINNYASEEHWFIITADIKLNDTTASDWYTSDSVKPWPVGEKFIGHVDGQGYTVSGLYVDNNIGSRAGAGLIPSASGNATITNINIDNCYFEGKYSAESYSGFLVGYVPSGLVRIAGCNVTNGIVGDANRFGGIVGCISTSFTTVDYCTFEGQKVGTKYGTINIGGIIGDSWGTATVSNSISKGIAAIGKAYSAFSAVYSDVSQTETYVPKADIIVLQSDDMIGDAAKTSMNKLNWNYFKTNADGIPTAKNNIDLSTAATKGTPGAVWSGFAAAGFAEGTGTIGDPYIISTAEELYRFSLEVTAKNTTTPAYYKITHDIYLNDVSDENWKEKDNLNNWIVSSTLDGPSFNGHLDGGYHVIYGMYSNHNTEYNACGLVPRVNEGATFSRLGFSEGFMMNNTTYETYTGAFIGWIIPKGSAVIPDGQYNRIKFTECFVDDTFEIYSYYAGGFAGGVPIGVEFVDCFSNVYIGDGAKHSGALLGNAFYSTYPDSFTNCYAFPASDWTIFSDVSEMVNAETNTKGMVEGSVKNCYYYGSTVTYFDLLFYKSMQGDAARTNMLGFDFDNIWMTVDGGSPVLRGFANAEQFTSNREVYTKISFVTGTEDIVLPDMEGTALSPLNLPVPEREGYFFAGWYVYEEGACEYDYGVFPVIETTLYAKWTANSVSQNFENYVNTKYDYDDDYVYYRPGVSGYSSMKVHGGSKAMLRKGESAEEQDIILNATEPIAVGEEYRINFWVSTEQADTDATISLVHYTWPDFQDPNMGVEKMVEIESLEVGKWTSYTYKFKASTPWVGIRTSGNAQIYMDDFLITSVAGLMKDPNTVNDYDYFYSLGETYKNTTGQALSAMLSTSVNTLAPTSAVSTEDTNNTIAFLVTVILAASALVVLSRVSLGNFEQEIKNDIEE